MIAGVLVLSSTPALAEVTLSVSPAILELEGGPGDTGRIAITVVDKGDEPTDIVTGLAELEGMVGDHSALAWSEVVPARVALQPGESTVVEYVVRIPDDAPSGGRYATITISTAPHQDPDASPDPNAATLVGRIQVPVFLTVDDGTDALQRRPIAIERTALFLGRDGALSLAADVSNGGNVHVPLVGHATLTEAAPSPAPSPSASPLADLAFAMGRLLPEATRTYVADEVATLPLGATYDLSVEFGSPADDGTTIQEVLATSAQTITPTPSMSVGSIDVCRATDGGYLGTVSLTNDGSLGLVPDVLVELRDATDAVVATANAGVQALSWPGSTVEAVAQVPPGMPDGTWSLRASVTYGPDLTAEASVPFVTGASPDAPTACPTPDTSPAPSPSASPAG